jgi:hypothetical protein
VREEITTDAPSLAERSDRTADTSSIAGHHRNAVFELSHRVSSRFHGGGTYLHRPAGQKPSSQFIESGAGRIRRHERR